MATAAFNETLGTFIDELGKAFPRESNILVGVKTAFELAVTSNARLPLDGFMEHVSPLSQAIMGRDEDAIIHSGALSRVPFVKDLHIQNNWASAPAGTKDAIWQYLETLIVLGMGVHALPEQLMSQVEGLAQDLACSMSNPDAPMPDMRQIMSGVTDIMNGVSGWHEQESQGGGGSEEGGSGARPALQDVTNVQKKE